jgi:nicotinate-nucleotide pyrophosphorylase (carboxylating)
LSLGDSVVGDVRRALEEDLGSGDASADLIDSGRSIQAEIMTRQSGVLAGRDWVDAAFLLLDPDIQLDWHARDGDRVRSDQPLCRLTGRARPILSGERTALNFLQLLSGVATRTAAYVERVAGTGARILDTRKTLPGLRAAQKHAVVVGGGHNHRMGLFDMVMLKENHIAAAGGIQAAVDHARTLHPTLPIEVETETLDELEEALAAGADRIMLDNFSLDDLKRAVGRAGGRAILEASGGIDLDTVRPVADCGVDEISVGDLTKTVLPLDLSLRVVVD